MQSLRTLILGILLIPLALATSCTFRLLDGAGAVSPAVTHSGEHETDVRLPSRHAPELATIVSEVYYQTVQDNTNVSLSMADNQGICRLCTGSALI